MKIGNLEITASRWPWQACTPHWSHLGNTPARYGWGKVPGMARFGGGWDWKLGIAIAGREILLDLVFGTIRITRQAPKPRAAMTDERRAERHDEQLWTVAGCVVLILACIALALIEPAACKVVGDTIPALCAN
jgi:hypothetical protein